MYNFFRKSVLFIGKYFAKKEQRDFFLKRLTQNFNELNAGEYIWIHCSSVGEINLSEELVKKFYSISRKNILLSVFTDTGYKLALNKYSKYKNIKIIYFPLDCEKEINKILKKIKIKLLVLVETEIWPNLINITNKNDGRIILVNGRISNKSYKRYKFLKFYLKKILDKIDYFYMQSEEDVKKIISLGAEKEKVENSGNLKYSTSYEHYLKEELVEYKNFLNLGNNKIFVAGSTRSGEEEILLKVFRNLKNFSLILVPRHIERTNEIIELLEKEKFDNFIKYSDLEKNKISTVNKIIVVDKIGILRKLYAISDITFVGGTLVNIGGHNILEPLYYNKVPIFGKYLQNVKKISEEILEEKIAYKVESLDDFLRAISDIENNMEDLSKKIKNFLSLKENIVLKIVNNENNIFKSLDSNADDTENLWKHFFNSKKSHYNIYMYKLLEYPEYIMFDTEKINNIKGKWKEIFNNSNSLVLEIGTGSGNFIRELAQKNQDKNFIGLELRFKRLCLAAEKCKKRNIKNVIFLRRRGEEILDFIDKQEINDLYINFPDPWEGNEKNRIIQKSLFDKLDIIMKKDGKIYFKTDHDKYYQDVLELIDNLNNYVVIFHTNDLHNSEKKDENIKTEFEQLFLHKHNKNINYIEILKTN